MCVFLDVWCIMFYGVYQGLCTVQHLFVCIPMCEGQFGSMHKRGTTDAVFILRRMLKENHAKGKKLYVCFVNPENAFDSIPKKVLELAIMKKRIP